MSKKKEDNELNPAWIMCTLFSWSFATWILGYGWCPYFSFPGLLYFIFIDVIWGLTWWVLSFIIAVVAKANADLARDKAARPQHYACLDSREISREYDLRIEECGSRERQGYSACTKLALRAVEEKCEFGEQKVPGVPLNFP
jgi:hypothetical protein